MRLPFIHLLFFIFSPLAHAEDFFFFFPLPRLSSSSFTRSVRPAERARGERINPKGRVIAVGWLRNGEDSLVCESSLECEGSTASSTTNWTFQLVFRSGKMMNMLLLVHPETETDCAEGSFVPSCVQHVPHLIRVQRGVNLKEVIQTISNQIFLNYFLAHSKDLGPMNDIIMKAVWFHYRFLTFVLPHFFLFHRTLIRRGTCCTPQYKLSVQYVP